MPRQTKFAEQWLDQVDANQHTLRWWCKAAPKDIYAAFCTLCYKTVPCDNMGLIQLLQHAKGKKHMEIANVRFSQRQQHLVVLPTSAASNIASEISSVGAPSMFCVAKSHKDQVSMAEIRWCFHVVQNDLPFAASDNVGDLFKLMFTATNELSTLANKRKVCVDKKKRHLDSSLHNESPDPPTKKAKSSKRDGKE